MYMQWNYDNSANQSICITMKKAFIILFLMATVVAVQAKLIP